MRTFARICVVVTAMAAALVATPATAAPIGTVALPWSKAGPAQADFRGVDCAKPDHCVAVGAINGRRGAPLAATRIRGRWHPEILPIPSGGAFGWLEHVSCPTTTWCAAIGVSYLDQYDNHVPFGAVLAGGVWTEVAVALPDGAHNPSLDGISCAAIAQCVAVGGGPLSGGTATLVETFSDGSWTPVNLPAEVDPKGQLHGVDCAAATSCTAVGRNAGGKIVRLQLSGSTWSLVRLAEPDGSTGATADAVTCPEVDDCTFVGTYADAVHVRRPFAEHLTSGSHAVDVLPVPAQSDVVGFAGLSCAVLADGAQRCVAVGQGAVRSVAETLIDGEWTATVFGTQSSAKVHGVACTVDGQCLAVGINNVGSLTDPALDYLLDSDGLWTEHRIQLAGAPWAPMEGVSCADGTTCVAVGADRSSADGSFLGLELRDEVGWHAGVVRTSPTIDPYENYGISCPTTESCLTLARAGVDEDDRIVALQLSGSRWRAHVFPFHFGSVYYVSPPTCPSATWCTAVLSFFDEDVDQVRNVAVVEDDSTWTTTELPFPAGGEYVYVKAVSCSAPGACVAVGNYDVGSDHAAFADVLADETWTTSRIETGLPVGGPELTSIACPEADWCLAVGKDTGRTTPLAVVYNRGRWAARYVPTPEVAYGPQLVSVSCAARQSCTAVGSAGDLTRIHADRPLIDSLVGGTWHSKIVPAIDGLDGGLTSVSCPAGGACVCVGTYLGRDGGLHPMAVTQG